VHAKALARAASEQLAVNGAGTAPVHALLVLGPQEDALGAGMRYARFIVRFVSAPLLGHT